jgi:hypothetical protein
LRQAVAGVTAQPPRHPRSKGREDDLVVVGPFIPFVGRGFDRVGIADADFAQFDSMPFELFPGPRACGRGDRLRLSLGPAAQVLHRCGRDHENEARGGIGRLYPPKFCHEFGAIGSLMGNHQVGGHNGRDVTPDAEMRVARETRCPPPGGEEGGDLTVFPGDGVTRFLPWWTRLRDAAQAVDGAL